MSFASLVTHARRTHYLRLVTGTFEDSSFLEAPDSSPTCADATSTRHFFRGKRTTQPPTSSITEMSLYFLTLLALQRLRISRSPSSYLQINGWKMSRCSRSGTNSSDLLVRLLCSPKTRNLDSDATTTVWRRTLAFGSNPTPIPADRVVVRYRAINFHTYR